MNKLLIACLLLTANFLYGDISFTDEEQKFIDSKEIACVTTGTWPPFNGKSIDGQLDGVGIDYLSLVKEHTGLKISCKEYPKWSEVLSSILTKQADLIVATSISQKKENYGLFSKPYLSYPIAIATNLDNVFITSNAFLNNKKIAVGRGYSAKNILLEEYPDINFVETDTIDEALLMLSKGEVDAVVDILPVLSYNITKLGFANLKIAGTTQLKFDVRFMTRDDYSYLPLVSILNKGIDAITDEEKSDISNKWASVKFDQKIDYATFVYIGVPLLLLLLYFLYSNRKLKKAKQALRDQANTDPLTSLYNRRYLNQKEAEFLSNAKRHKDDLSLIAIDIDHFKKINDEYGHSFGDIVLKSLADKIKKSIRPSDYAVRLGGEEFLILLPRTPVLGAKRVAETLLQAAEDIYIEADHKEKLNFTISIGITQYDTSSDKNFDMAIHRADLALYDAKKNGRNQIVIFS